MWQAITYGHSNEAMFRQLRIKDLAQERDFEWNTMTKLTNVVQNEDIMGNKIPIKCSLHRYRIGKHLDGIICLYCVLVLHRIFDHFTSMSNPTVVLKME